MDTEPKPDLAEQLRREREDTRALRHALAISGESIRVLARERDAAERAAEEAAKSYFAMQKAHNEEQRQHEETKRELRARTNECDALQRRDVERLKRSRRK